MPENIYYNLLPFNIEGTTLIPLSQGYWALVDTEVALVMPKFSLLKSKLNSRFYGRRTIRIGARRDNKRITQLLHRFVLEYYEIDAPNDIDHVNGNGLDNRLCNLRAATQIQNSGNVELNIKNKSGFRGVYWNAELNKWQGQIGINGKRVYLGLSTDINLLAKAYDRAAIKHFGIEFAFTNFPKSDYL